MSTDRMAINMNGKFGFIIYKGIVIIGVRRCPSGITPPNNPLIRPCSFLLTDNDS